MSWICNHIQNGSLSHCGPVLKHEKHNLSLTLGIFNLILAQLTAISCFKSVIDLLKGFFLLETQITSLGRPIIHCNCDFEILGSLGSLCKICTFLTVLYYVKFTISMFSHKTYLPRLHNDSFRLLLCPLFRK